MKTVAIIGAGIAGAGAAARLRDENIEVTVFDRGRNPGGRLSTRTQFERQFDHGAQYLKPHSARSAQLFSTWRKAGWIKTWPAHGLELPERQTLDTSSWHVATPRQASLIDRLLENTHLQKCAPIISIAGTMGQRYLEDTQGENYGPFEIIVVTGAAEQSAALLAPFPELQNLAQQVESRPTLATMVLFEEPVVVDFEACYINAGPLAWACRDSSKPDRPKLECWVLHATEEWSRSELENSPEKIAAKMLSEFALLVPSGLPPVSFCRAHRWRYALPINPLELPYCYDRELKIGLAGDWCNTANVDGAYWSGHDLAEAILGDGQVP